MEYLMMELPSPKLTKQLGIQSANVDRLDYHYKREKEMATKFAEQIREYLEIDENTCRYKNETLTRCSQQFSSCKNRAALGLH